MLRPAFKLIALLAIALLSTLSAQSQEKKIRLIIRGDDMGFSHSGNEALVKCYKEGIERSIEVIVPSPWFPEAVKMLQENPGVDVGVHLAITSEWDNVKWRPVTACPSLTNADGYFYPMIQANENYPGQSISENKWNIQDIEKEFRAQIELALKKIPRVSHISGHMGCTRLNEDVRALTAKLAKEYKIDIDLDALGVKSIWWDGAHKTFEEKLATFKTMLGKLEAGNTYMFLEHPGIDGPELQAIHHIGYENVSSDRQGVTSLWTSAEIRKLISKKNIELISYKDLIR
jgi:predicted glycoside hydrolase/deacetylase ChbG (UPF0249 family)